MGIFGPTRNEGSSWQKRKKKKKIRSPIFCPDVGVNWAFCLYVSLSVNLSFRSFSPPALQAVLLPQLAILLTLKGQMLTVACSVRPAKILHRYTWRFIYISNHFPLQSSAQSASVDSLSSRPLPDDECMFTSDLYFNCKKEKKILLWSTQGTIYALKCFCKVHS